MGGCQDGQTSINLPGLPGRRRKAFPTLHPIKSDDNYCLARSISVGIEWHRQYREGIKKRQKILQQDKENAAVELLAAAGCSLQKQRYGFADAKRIVDYLNRQYGKNKYRVVVLGASKMYRVLWKSHPKPECTDIVLILYSQHYWFIGEPRRLFQVSVLTLKHILFQK